MATAGSVSRHAAVIPGVLGGEQSGHGWARLPNSCKGSRRDEPSRASGLTRPAGLGHRRRKENGAGATLVPWKGKGEQFQTKSGEI